jgi:hypothetical protein
VLRWSLLGHVLGLLFLADVKLLGGLLALGEGVSVDWISHLSLVSDSMITWGLSYPPADPVGLEAPEPVEPSAMRRAEAEK